MQRNMLRRAVSSALVGLYFLSVGLAYLIAPKRAGS